MSIDWDALRQLARAAREQAYAPYSQFAVGAAGVTTEGRMVSGCNVENASYGVTLCAECGLVSELVRTGGGQLDGLVVLDAAEHAIAPCGRCLQILSEHVASEASIQLATAVVPFTELMPHAFGSNNLS